MDGSAWIGIAGAIVTVLSALGAGVMAYLTWRQKTGQEESREKISQHEVLISRQEKTIVRMDGIQTQQQQTIYSLQNEHAECQAEMERIWAWLERLHATAMFLNSIARKDGHVVDDVPPMPSRREDHTASMEYQARSTEQNRRLAGSLRPKVPRSMIPPPPEPTAGQEGDSPEDKAPSEG
jgi:hypothetical protein